MLLSDLSVKSFNKFPLWIGGLFYAFSAKSTQQFEIFNKIAKGSSINHMRLERDGKGLRKKHKMSQGGGEADVFIAMLNFLELNYIIPVF